MMRGGSNRTSQLGSVLIWVAGLLVLPSKRLLPRSGLRSGSMRMTGVGPLVIRRFKKVWAIHDERLRTADLAAIEGVNAGLAAGDPTAAWAVWSVAAESALADAYRLARGPLP